MSEPVASTEIIMPAEEKPSMVDDMKKVEKKKTEKKIKEKEKTS